MEYVSVLWQNAHTVGKVQASQAAFSNVVVRHAFPTLLTTHYFQLSVHTHCCTGSAPLGIGDFKEVAGQDSEGCRVRITLDRTRLRSRPIFLVRLSLRSLGTQFQIKRVVVQIMIRKYAGLVNVT